MSNERREMAVHPCRRREKRRGADLTGAACAACFARDLDHPGVMSRPTTAPCAASANNVTGAGCQIEGRGPEHRRGEGDQPPLPSAIAAVRQGHGDEIVAVRDCRKERPDMSAFAVGRRNPIGQGRFRQSASPFVGHVSPVRWTIVRMLPSSTVENYLKAIYQGQSTLPAGTAWCRWARSPRRSASRRARPRRWSRRSPSRGSPSTSPTAACG